MSEKKRITFELHAPEASTVMLAGTFDDWSDKADPMKKDLSGNGTNGKPLVRGNMNMDFWLTVEE